MLRYFVKASWFLVIGADLDCTKYMKQLHCYIRENGWPARIAARYLHARQMAIVFNRTMYLHGVSAADFLKNTPWLRHEVCHVLQYRRYTFPGFILLYLLQSLRHGYYNNRFEKEARIAERDTSILNNVVCHITQAKRLL